MSYIPDILPNPDYYAPQSPPSNFHYQKSNFTSVPRTCSPHSPQCPSDAFRGASRVRNSSRSLSAPLHSSEQAGAPQPWNRVWDPLNTHHNGGCERRLVWSAGVRSREVMWGGVYTQSDCLAEWLSTTSSTCCQYCTVLTCTRVSQLENVSTTNISTNVLYNTYTLLALRLGHGSTSKLFTCTGNPTVELSTLRKVHQGLYRSIRTVTGLLQSVQVLCV